MRWIFTEVNTGWSRGNPFHPSDPRIYLFAMQKYPDLGHLLGSLAAGSLTCHGQPEGSHLFAVAR